LLRITRFQSLRLSALPIEILWRINIALKLRKKECVFVGGNEMISGLKGEAYLKPARLLSMTVLFLFSLWGIARSAVLLDKVVAVVNKEVITWSELYKAMQFDASREMKSLSDEERKKIFAENEKRFLESMVDTKLELQAAKGLGIEATKDEVSDAIDTIKKKYSMDEKAFEESLKKEGFTLDEYKKRLADQIVLSKLVGQQVRNKIVVTDSEIADYMTKNKNDEYRIRQIFFKKPAGDFDKNELEAKAEEVMQKLKNGEDFSTLAYTYSEDPSAKSGGELGFIKKEYLGKEFLEAISHLSVGEVSAPFWTDEGLHIVQLEEKVNPENIAEYREIARKKIFEKKFKEEYRNWIRGLREKAYVDLRL
jgi:peptidyl-prolyl cis-trans isomerase SurA